MKERTVKTDIGIKCAAVSTSKSKPLDIYYTCFEKSTKDKYQPVVSGSYTIEAALIFPLILLVITALIYLGFFLHDQDRLEAVINETLLIGRNLVRNEAQMDTGFMDYEVYNKRGILYSLQANLQEKREEIYNYLQLHLNKGFFLADIRSIDVTVSHTEISLIVKADMVLPFVGLLPFFSGSKTVIVGSNQAAIGSNVEFLRVFDIFSGVAENMPVINDNLMKLQQILNLLK